DGQKEILMVRGKAGGPQQVNLLELKSPKVGPPTYRIRGLVRYEDVASGYLELLNFFPKEGPYFTRTVSILPGPLQELAGTSAWRAFELPFSLNRPDGSVGPPPTKLELNLMLTKGGTVYLRNLDVEQYSGAPLVQGWWRHGVAGVIGAVAGCTLGLLGA